MESSWKPAHLGIPVWDLDRSMEAYISTGIAAFEPEFLIDSSNIADYKIYGKTPDPVVKTRGVFGTIGNQRVELLQPVQGETVHKELLESTGEGIGHIAFFVDDLEAESAKLVAHGFPVILSIRDQGQPKPRAAYFDTRGCFSGLITELMQSP